MDIVTLGAAISKTENSVSAEASRAKLAETINAQTMGVQYINFFNKDGEINSLYNGTTITAGTTKNTVDGNVITFNRRPGVEYLTGQFISGLTGKTVKITFNCLSTGSATQGTFRIMARNNTVALKIEIFGTGEKSYTYDCGTNDELLFCFGGNGSAAGVQIENLMIRDNNISDDTYREYVLPLQEQIKNLSSRVGSFEKPFRHIETLTVNEEGVSMLKRTTEPDGTPYDFKKVLVRLIVPKGNVTSSGQINLNSTWTPLWRTDFVSASSNSVSTVKAAVENGFLDTFALCTKTVTERISPNCKSEILFTPIENIHTITAFTDPSSVHLPIGTTLEIYAVDM